MRYSRLKFDERATERPSSSSLKQRPEPSKGYGFGGREVENTYLVRCSADVIRVEAALDVLHQPDGGTREPGAAMRMCAFRGKASRGDPVGADARDGEAADDRVPLVRGRVDADHRRRLVQRVNDALNRVLIQAQVRRRPAVLGLDVEPPASRLGHALRGRVRHRAQGLAAARRPGSLLIGWRVRVLISQTGVVMHEGIATVDADDAERPGGIGAA